MKRPRRVLVIGLGRFGSALVDELWQTGCEILAVDKNPEAIDAIKARTSAAFVADATDPAVLESIGARDVDVAVVTAGEAFEGVVLCVSQLAQLGVKVIFARAANDRQAYVLERVGATRAVQVENEMGRRLAVQVLNPVAGHILDFATHFRVVPWQPTPGFVGKTLAETGFRSYEINVIGWFSGDSKAPRLNFPSADYRIEATHTLLLVGQEEAFERFLARVDR
ncbi:MAG: TrkA family potassium uptake protein [Pseudomonadota bacterium]|nr:MAG: TrkA family potassium uptake protein [Pseudomonadota bacterium]